jgi:uncharacterized membrane protein YeaQ/YmgE (transglycosylase-associated protein family)
MSIVGWIFLGLISGFIANKIVNNTGAGVLGDVLLGMVGALIGGFAFTIMGARGITGFNVWSAFVSVLGAVIVLVLYRALIGHRRAA